MSQESVAQAPHPTQQTAHTVEGMLKQLSENVGQMMDMMGELNERVRHLEGGRSAPPHFGTMPTPLVTPPVGRVNQGRNPQFVLPPMPPQRGGQRGRGPGRGTPMQRLNEQEMGGPTLRGYGHVPLEEEFEEFEGEQEYYPPRRNPPRRDAYGSRGSGEEIENESLEDRHGIRPRPRPYNPRGRFPEDEYYEQEPRRARYAQPRRRNHGEEDEFKDIKITIPGFENARNPEVYLEWERKVDMAFEFRDCTERKKLKLITQEFSGYALTWWDDLNRKRMRNGEGPVSSWLALKREMRARFVPSNYERELHHKLQWLTQGNKSVEEYYEDMQTLLLRANLEESEEALLARFSRGQNREVYNIVELQTYANMEELLDKAIKVERQLRVAKFKGASTSSPYQKNTWNKGDVGLKKTSETPLPQKPEANQLRQPTRPSTTPWQNQPSTRESK